LVLEGGTMCVTCKSGLHWQAGQSAAVVKGKITHYWLLA